MTATQPRWTRRELLALAATAAVASCTSSADSTPSTNTTSTTESETPTTTTAPTAATTPPASSTPTNRRSRFQSIHITMPDAVRLAADIWLPDRAASSQVPTVLRATRYHRRDADAADDSEARDFLDEGWALVVVDTRGSGASFGTRPAELGTQEIRDLDDVIDWIASQPWSSGRVATYGISYSGTAAELTCGLGNRHLVATAPLFSDVDPYRFLVRPGGAFVAPFQLWLQANQVLDGVAGADERLASAMNVPVEDVRSMFPMPAPVDGPDGPALLRAARREHQANADLSSIVDRLDCYDDVDGQVNWTDGSVAANQPRLDATDVPVFCQLGWLDAATVDGAIQRFRTRNTPQLIEIGPWAHAGDINDSLRPDRTADVAGLSTWDQITSMINFLRPHLNGTATPQEPNKRIRFLLAGSDQWHETDVWPLTGGADQTFTIINPTAPRLATYHPDSTVGRTGRWVGNLTGTLVDHRALDSFDGDIELDVAQLNAEMKLVGTPRLSLRVTPSTDDQTLHAYLIARSDKSVAIISETHHRLRHHPEPNSRRPTYRRADYRRLVPGRAINLDLDLTTVGAQLSSGTALTLRLALGDADTFRHDGDDNQTITVDQLTLTLPTWSP